MNIWASRNDFGSQWELRTHHLVLYDCTCMRRRNVREVHIKHEGRSWGLFPAAKYTLAHMWQCVWMLSLIFNRLIKGSLYEVRKIWRMGLVLTKNTAVLEGSSWRDLTWRYQFWQLRKRQRDQNQVHARGENVPNTAVQWLLISVVHSHQIVESDTMGSR